jgi:hypothetical protein
MICRVRDGETHADYMLAASSGGMYQSNEKQGNSDDQELGHPKAEEVENAVHDEAEQPEKYHFGAHGGCWRVGWLS